MSSLIDLPTVTQRLILDCLSLPELLNLRLVNQSISSWISRDYLERRISKIEVQILDLTTLNRFLSTASNLPFTRFYFGFSPKLNLRDKSKKWEQKVYYNSKAMKDFSLKFGSRIRALRVHQMHMCSTSAELEFYESLTSLKSLELDRTHIKLRSSNDEELFKRIMETTQIPSGKVLISLEELSFGESGDFYAYDFISKCPNLRKIRPGNSRTFSYKLNHCILKLTEYIRQRALNTGKVDLEVNLKKVFGMTNVDLIKKDDLQAFLNIVNFAGVRLSNVCGRFLDLLQKHNVGGNSIEKVSENILSFYGLPRVIYECPIVKEVNVALVVKSGPEVVAANANQVNLFRDPSAVEFHKGSDRPEWESLREIEMKIVPVGLCRSVLMGMVKPYPPDPLRVLEVSTQDALDVSGFLLGRNSSHNRNQVQKINFSLAEETAGVFVSPEDLAGHFPNLPHLQLEVDCFSSTDYTQLFRLLGKKTKITSLRLNSSITFTDETFMGTSKDSIPPFATLKHLEVFELISNRMVHTDITDRFFVEVLQGMSLHVFHLWQDHYVSITEFGQTAILNGPFAKTIRSFECRKRYFPGVGVYPLDFLKDICENNCKLLYPKYKIIKAISYGPATIIQI